MEVLEVLEEFNLNYVILRIYKCCEIAMHYWVIDLRLQVTMINGHAVKPLAA